MSNITAVLATENCSIPSKSELLCPPLGFTIYLVSTIHKSSQTNLQQVKQRKMVRVDRLNCFPPHNICSNLTEADWSSGLPRCQQSSLSISHRPFPGLSPLSSLSTFLPNRIVTLIKYWVSIRKGKLINLSWTDKNEGSFFILKLFMFEKILFS